MSRKNCVENGANCDDCLSANACRVNMTNTCYQCTSTQDCADSNLGDCALYCFKNDGKNEDGEYCCLFRRDDIEDELKANCGVANIHLEARLLDRDKNPRKYETPGENIVNVYDVYSNSQSLIGDIIEQEYSAPWGKDTYCTATLHRFIDCQTGKRVEKFRTAKEALGWMANVVRCAVKPLLERSYGKK